jgi:UDP-glucose 4-epimerase
MTEAANISSKQCLVLGAGGFIGTNLCRHLLQRGAKVQGFGRSNAFPDALEGVRWISGDFADQSALAQAIEGSELVFHLVGSRLPEVSNQDPVGDLESNVAGTLRLLDICHRHGVRKVIFVSSGGTVYGIAPQIPIPETAPTEPITAYGIGKLAIEKYLALYRHLHGLDYAILRISNPFGPFQGGYRRQGVIAAFIQQALNGETLEIWGDGEVVRDFIYIDDVMTAICEAALHAGPYRLFNVGQGIGRSVNQILADIEAVLGRGVLPKRYKPSRAADVPVNVLDVGLIRRELGWQPRHDWRSSLRATADWLIEAGTADAR